MSSSELFCSNSPGGEPHPLISGWAVKLVCDATGASEPVECNYNKCVGTSWTEEVSESMDISAGVSAEISVMSL